MPRSTPMYLAAALLLLVHGCAQGGGLPDSGAGGGIDAGTTRPDAFVPPRDTGPGPDPVDSGMIAADAGSDAATPTPDAGGQDAGPSDAGGRDAGPPDAGMTSCGESPCRISPPQCGCAGGQGCYPTSTGRECRVAGTTAEGGRCTSHDMCQAGMVCASGLCHRVCLSGADCPGRGSECVGSVTEGPTTMQVCSTPCEPAAASAGSGCPSGMACRYYERGGSYYTECVAEGSTSPGGDCTSSNQCTQGYTCVFFSPFAPGSCTRSCRTDGSGPCASCFPFFDSSPSIEGTEYGFCG